MSTKTPDQIYASNPSTSVGATDRFLGYPVGGPMYGILASDLITNLTVGCLLLNGTTKMTAPLPGYVGSESLPGYAFDGDTDTGMYRSGANVLAFGAGGLGYLHISAAGLETVNGVSFVGPLQGAVGGVTPAAGAFTTLSASGLLTLSAGGNLTPATTPATNALGYLGMPQLNKSGNYTLTMAEAGWDTYFTATATGTIPANASVAFPIGTIGMMSVDAGHVLTVPITTDTLTFIPSGTTGTRTVTGPGWIAFKKKTATAWWCWGLNVT